jgi:hypothetical protein
MFQCAPLISEFDPYLGQRIGKQNRASHAVMALLIAMRCAFRAFDYYHGSWVE